MTPSSLSKEDSLIQNHFDRIMEWVVGDIKKCCKLQPDGTCLEGGALVGSFILWCCAIDYFGGLYTGDSSPKGTKNRIFNFIKIYMKDYNFEKIYDLRWSLLHFYSPNHYILIHENNINDARNNIHLRDTSRGTLLHLGCSIYDLENAVKSYREDLSMKSNLKIKLLNYYQKQPIIAPIDNINTFIKDESINLSGSDASGTVGEYEWYKKHNN